MPTKRAPSPNAVPVKHILNKILGAKPKDVPRLLLSGKATAKLNELSRKTSIPVKDLADAAINAIHAALSNSPTPLAIKNARLREWLNAKADDDARAITPE
jgi:hypothetical protein